MRTYMIGDLPLVPARAGRCFAQVIRLAPDAPLVHRAVTREIEHPYRTGRSVIVRIGRRGLVLGRYDRNGAGEFDALRRATILREPSRDELDAFDDAVLHGPGAAR